MEESQPLNLGLGLIILSIQELEESQPLNLGLGLRLSIQDIGG